MSLANEIWDNYLDANHLVAPRRCHPTDVNPSGNGPCYTGEFVAILKRRGELTTELETEFVHAMALCMKVPGDLTRGPGQPDLESVDDYYGFLAGCQAADAPELAESVLDFGWEHRGSFNSDDPGKWTWTTFLWRQPQLLFAMYAAARKMPKAWNPLTWWKYGLLAWTALVIATSCMTKADKLSDTDARRLSWLLIQATAPVSWVCTLAGKVWARRLLKHYGPEGMREVARRYYEVSPPHPFTIYWPAT